MVFSSSELMQKSHGLLPQAAAGLCVAVSQCLCLKPGIGVTPEALVGTFAVTRPSEL